ncbi:DUF4342 domain-containing protein [Anaerolineae bacterium CFX7]|nr:DUF4342 domain-containing protein [Anaerolineae bacterium CFX7]
MEEHERTEEFRVDTDKIVGKAKALYVESNVRRVSLKTKEGKLLLEMPLWLALVITALSLIVVPWLAIILVIVGLVLRVNLIVERHDLPAPPANTEN